MDDLERVVALYQHSQSMSDESVLREVAQLTDPVYSARLLGKVTGVSRYDILNALGKTERTGGRLEPRTLPVILELRENGFDREKVVWCVRNGTSQSLLARLTGFTPSRIHNACRKGTR